MTPVPEACRIVERPEHALLPRGGMFNERPNAAIF